MSLRTFHVIFISASLLLCVLVLAWSLATQSLWLAASSGVLAVGLLAYGVTFVRHAMNGPEVGS